MYIVYDPTSGMIQQTISGPGKEYGPEQLDTRNLTWIWLEGAMNVDPTKNYVDVATKMLRPAEAMSLVADKITFDADGVDEAKVTGIPAGANVAVLCDGAPVSQHIIHDGEIEISANAPATYEVRVTCWRFLPAQLIIQAVEPVPVAAETLTPSDGSFGTLDISGTLKKPGPVFNTLHVENWTPYGQD